MDPSYELDEEQRVELWNFSLFSEQGFDGLSIATLLGWGVSPHDTLPLVRSGCPLDLVLCIVRPLDEREPEPALAERLSLYSVR